MAVATLNFLLSLANNMMVKDRITREGPAGWAKRTDHHGLGLIGRVFAMVGLGNIGRETLRLIKPLDMEVIVHDPALSAADAAELGVRLCDLDTIFRGGRFRQLALPVDGWHTLHLVNAARLAQMKPTAYLINTARGPVVDQAALYDALVAGTIAGAGWMSWTPNRRPPTRPSPASTMSSSRRTRWAGPITCSPKWRASTWPPFAPSPAVKPRLCGQSRGPRRPPSAPLAG